MIVSYKIGTSSVYGNVVARSQFPADAQRIMDSGGNWNGYAVVDGHFTYVGAGATGQEAYNRVYGTSSVPAGSPMPASGIPPNAPGGSSYVGSSDNPRTVPAAPPGYVAPIGGTGGSGSGAGGSVAPTESDAAKAAAQARQNAYEFLVRQFAQYGLEGLGPQIMQWLVQGYDGATISLLIQDTPQYKQRFSGNEARKKAGLAVLSPAEYLAVERSYAQILRSAGLPAGFYDDPKTDFADWIGKDVSPTEIKERVDRAVDLTNNTNPGARQALAAYYGITDGMITAHFLDAKRALPLLQKQATAAEFGGAALRHGMSLTDRTRAEGFVDLGLTGAAAEKGYSEIGGFLAPTQQIAERWHESYSQTEAEDEVFGGLASAKRKRERLYQSERSLFEGRAGVDSSGLKSRSSGSY